MYNLLHNFHYNELYNSISIDFETLYITYIL